MKTITIAKGFTLTLGPRDKRKFNPGTHEVDDEIADHWYVKAHTVAPAEPEEPAGLTAEEIAAKTKEVVLGLISEADPVPNMDVVNKALKAAQLPAIKAADRDAILSAKE